jgi:hypothetical protein
MRLWAGWGWCATVLPFSPSDFGALWVVVGGPPATDRMCVPLLLQLSVVKQTKHKGITLCYCSGGGGGGGGGGSHLSLSFSNSKQ